MGFVRGRLLIGVVAAATVAGAVAAPSAFANVAPSCPSGGFTISSGGSTGLTANCSDSDGPNALTYQIVSGPTHGSISSSDPTGAVVTYTNNAALPGNDSFTYQAFDGVDYSNIATVNITVTGPPPPPPPPPGHASGQTLSAAVSPDTQSAASFGDVSLGFSADTTFSALPSASTKEAVIHFDDDIAFDPTGLPTCDPSQIQTANTAQAIANCGAAQVGSGNLTARSGSSLPGSPLPFVITVFNAAPSGGNPQVLIHLRSDSLGLTLTLLGSLRPSTLGSDYGKELDITNWPNTVIPTSHFDLNFANPSGFHYVTARCGDADQTWNFQVDLSFYDNTTQSATSTQACHAVDPDTDGDGITDSVDTQPATPSSAFDDGTGTSGSITDSAGLPVAIKNASNPSDGVHVSVGAGSGNVTIQACGRTDLFAAGTEADLTCGSTILNVTQGQVQVLIPGELTVVTVPAGSSARISDTVNGTFQVQNLGVGNVTVTVDGTPSTVGPGSSSSVDGVNLPTDKGQCKQDGWKAFHNGNAHFKNQGDCVSFVATGAKNPPAG